MTKVGEGRQGVGETCETIVPRGCIVCQTQQSTGLKVLQLKYILDTPTPETP